jgi:exo-beta-1,3-glucanase (GH17 family)
VIGEIAAIVAGVNAATSAIKQVAETTNDIQSISGFLSALGGAEVELQRAQNEGKLSEADAVKAALAKKQIQETMKEIKDLFTVSGNGQLYQEAMQAMAAARKAKQLELARKAAQKKQFWKEVKEYAAIGGVLLFLLPMTLALLIGWLTRK